jgi:hypothetical protein
MVRRCVCSVLIQGIHVKNNRPLLPRAVIRAPHFRLYMRYRYQFCARQGDLSLQLLRDMAAVAVVRFRIRVEGAQRDAWNSPDRPRKGGSGSLWNYPALRAAERTVTEAAAELSCVSDGYVCLGSSLQCWHHVRTWIRRLSVLLHETGFHDFCLTGYVYSESTTWTDVCRSLVRQNTGCDVELFHFA